VRQPYVVPRRRLVFAVWLTVLALPILVIDNIPRTEARATPVKTELIQAAPDFTASSSTTTVESSTTVAEETSTTAATPTTRAAVRRAASATIAAPRPTTTTTTAPPNREQGGASWYDYRAGECAHRTLPRGTVVTIRSLANGATATCTVTDRGPYGDTSRIIDLDRGTFAQLADPSTGVIQVEITW
jgi:rare lipoprotein A